MRSSANQQAFCAFFIESSKCHFAMPSIITSCSMRCCRMHALSLLHRTRLLAVAARTLHDILSVVVWSAQSPREGDSSRCLSPLLAYWTDVMA